MATDLQQRHLDAAGLVMRALRVMPTHWDAQVSLALASAWICSQWGINPDLFTHVLNGNIKQVASDPDLMPRAIERIQRISTDPDLRRLFLTP